MNSLKKLRLAAALIALALFPVTASAAEVVSPKTPAVSAAVEAPDAAKGLFVVITAAEPMTQSMALVLSTQTVMQGKSVQILLCGPAGELALKNSPQVMMKPLNKSPQMMLADLIAKGVKVEVCPLYLPNSGKTEADLVKGVSVAKPPVVAKRLRADGLRLFTF